MSSSFGPAPPPSTAARRRQVPVFDSFTTKRDLCEGKTKVKFLNINPRHVTPEGDIISKAINLPSDTLAVFLEAMPSHPNPDIAKPTWGGAEIKLMGNNRKDGMWRQIGAPITEGPGSVNQAISGQVYSKIALAVAKAASSRELEESRNIKLHGKVFIIALVGCILRGSD